MIIKTSASFLDAKIYLDSELSDQEYPRGYIISSKDEFTGSYVVTLKPWNVYFITGFRNSIEAKLFIFHQRIIILNAELNAHPEPPDSFTEKIKGEIKKISKFQNKIKDKNPELFL